MLDADAFDEEIFGFHAQQVVEKSLKSWLSLLGVDYPRIHDLEELLGMLCDRGASVPPRFRELVDLTDFAVQFRYEAYDSLEAELTRDKVLQQAGDLVSHVGALVAEAGPPETR